jgi:L-galactose dehydrogenase
MSTLSTELTDYRKLGDTDLRVSTIGFGASPLGDVYTQTEPSELEYTVQAAIGGGINFFDVSPYYGLTLAEDRLGRALQGRRHQVVLATKCGRYGLDRFDFSPKGIASGVDESLQRLRTDHVDILQAHDVEFGDARQIVDETIPAMRHLQAQGKARYIGITGYPLPTLIRIAQAVPVDTILSYCRYNLLITDMDDSLTAFARAKGIGLINASAFHMSMLTERGAPDWHPAPAEVREAGRKAAAFCRARGVNIADVALRFCLDHPYVSSTLIGMSTRGELQANLEVLGGRSDPALIAELRTLVGPAFNHVWPSGRIENRG